MIWAVALLVLGLAFVLAEVFFPSLGLFSVIAGVCILAADVIAFSVSGVAGYAFIAAELLLIPLVIYTGFKVLPHTGFGSRMLLQGPKTAIRAGAPELDHLVGKTGTTLSSLRPSGSARIDGERVSVVAQGPMVDAGTTVVVVSVEGTEVKVRPASSAEPDSNSANPHATAS